MLNQQLFGFAPFVALALVFAIGVWLKMRQKHTP
jgi:hypothetical protein